MLETVDVYMYKLESYYLVGNLSVWKLFRHSFPMAPQYQHIYYAPTIYIYSCYVYIYYFIYDYIEMYQCSLSLPFFDWSLG